MDIQELKLRGKKHKPHGTGKTNEGVGPQEEKLKEVGKESLSVQKIPSKRKGSDLFSLSTGQEKMDREGKLVGC